jgi:hypothetical protein
MSVPNPSLLETLQAYHDRGWRLVPIPHGQKQPTRRKWQNLRLMHGELTQAFRSLGNVGLLLGEPSGHLVDVDLDCAEARALAAVFLPPTNLCSGRAGASNSHWFYVAAGGTTTRLRDPILPDYQDRAMLVEFRSTGSQTLIPPSRHPGGEEIRWEAHGEPTTIDANALLAAVRRLAAAALLARHWPPAGSRHEVALVLAGGLIRSGWTTAETRTFIEAIAQVAGDPEVADRGRAVDSTTAALAAGSHATGWTRLADLLDPRLVKQIRAWVGSLKPAGGVDAAGHDGDAAAMSGGDIERVSQATKIVEFARATGFVPFIDLEGNPYCSVPMNGHLETWPIKAERLKLHLHRVYAAEMQKVPGTQMLQDARNALEAEARFTGPVFPVGIRVMRHEGMLYLDLGDPTWQVVAITPDGWTVVDSGTVPVRFRRPRGLAALPLPDRSGVIGELRDLLNLGDDDDFLLLVGWVIGLLYPEGPRPLLQLLGEQGSAKSSAAALLRSLVDPNELPLRGLPADEGDLLIAARSSAVLVFDNVSKLPQWQSDAFCRLATGGGLSKRELYTDADEVLLMAKRPVLLTGISDVVTASDLLDRAITVTLPPIPLARRRTDQAVQRSMTAARPRILGALLNAAVVGLQRLGSTTLAEVPRMADFTTWVEACAFSFGWEPGHFADCLLANRRAADSVAIDSSPLGPAMIGLMEERDNWEGTASQLLEALNSLVAEEVRKEPGWPKQGNRASAILRRLAPNLRSLGIDCRLGRVSKGKRLITVRTIVPVSPAGPLERQARGEWVDDDVAGEVSGSTNVTTGVAQIEIAGFGDDTTACESRCVDCGVPIDGQGDLCAACREGLAARYREDGSS